MKTYALIEISNDDNAEYIINAFDDVYLANRYLDSFRKNQPNNTYHLKILDSTEEDLEDGND